MKKRSNTRLELPFFLLVLLPFLLLNACKKEADSYIPKMVLGTSDSLSVSHRESGHSIVFVSNVAWHATTSDEWISIINSSGEKGLDSIYFDVDANKGAERSGKITISAETGELSTEVTIIQETGISKNFFVKEGTSGEGHFWDEATSLSDALANVAAGDTIFIAAGTYYPDKVITNGDPANEGDKTFEIAKNITLIGGYPENASDGATSDPATNKTILSGDLGSGNVAFHVVAVTAPKVDGQKVTINGLTITGGDAGGSGSFLINGTKYYRNNGGGVIIGNSTVEIKNCEIINNTGQHSAGGMFINNGDVSIKDSRINKNTAGGNGGAIWAYSSSNLKLYNCEIAENYSKGTAGAIYAYPNATLFIYNSRVNDNKGESYGAGVYYRESSGALVNCIIDGNSSTSDNGGGGLLLYGGCDVRVVSTTITNNDIQGPGGGVYRKSGTNTLFLYNSIISGNSQISGSSDVDAASGQPALTLKATIAGDGVYDASGAKIGDGFDVKTMLSPEFLPIGNNNPALEYGMNAEALTSLNETFDVQLEDEFISSDLNGVSRSGKTIMGALVQ